MKQKMNLKSGMFNGLPAYACALLLLAAGLVLSVLYAVTVGSAELSVGEVYRVILYELFRWGDTDSSAEPTVTAYSTERTKPAASNRSAQA